MLALESSRHGISEHFREHGFGGADFRCLAQRPSAFRIERSNYFALAVSNWRANDGPYFGLTEFAAANAGTFAPDSPPGSAHSLEHPTTRLKSVLRSARAMVRGAGSPLAVFEHEDVRRI